MKVWIVTDEEYPSYTVCEVTERQGTEVEVDQETLERWTRIEREHQEMKREIKDLLDPPCPECGHHQSRHQEWSKGWDYWGCLVAVNGAGTKKCRCQHGKPEGR